LIYLIYNICRTIYVIALGFSGDKDLGKNNKIIGISVGGVSAIIISIIYYSVLVNIIIK